MPEQAQNAERESEQALLQAAEQAFAAGDYRALQRKLQALHPFGYHTPSGVTKRVEARQGVQSESVVTRVQALRRAISVDPVHLALLLACLLALIVIAIHEGTHESGSEHGATSPRGSAFRTSTQGALYPRERTPSR